MLKACINAGFVQHLLKTCINAGFQEHLHKACINASLQAGALPQRTDKIISQTNQHTAR